MLENLNRIGINHNSLLIGHTQDVKIRIWWIWYWLWSLWFLSYSSWFLCDFDSYVEFGGIVDMRINKEQIYGFPLIRGVDKGWDRFILSICVRVGFEFEQFWMETSPGDVGKLPCEGWGSEDCSRSCEGEVPAEWRDKPLNFGINPWIPV
jgi:hypothetical protein